MRLSPGGNVTGGPALAVTPAGEAVAAWVEDGTVRVASGQAASGTWNGAVVIPASDPATGDPDLAVNPAGDGVVVWSASGSVRAAFRPHGSGWSAAATVAPISGAPDAHARVGIATDSMVSHGCIISGGRIHKSVLSVGCRVNSFTEVEESVLFERVKIGRNARLKRCIVDKDVEIPNGEQIGYDIEADRRRFFVTDNGIVVIPKNAVIPAGFWI